MFERLRLWDNARRERKWRKIHPLDQCERCKGTRGGVYGNENIVEGVTLCDYCHADDLGTPT